MSWDHDHGNPADDRLQPRRHAHPDLDRHVDFHRRTFGATVVQTMEAREDHPRMALIEVGGAAHLRAFEVPASEIAGERDRIGRRGPIDHFALAVGSREDLEAVRDRLRDAGASPGELTDFGSELSVFFRDPDGAELEVCWHADEAG